MDPKAVKSDLVLILDYGSQYTHLITRRIRALNIFSRCISGTSTLDEITSLNPRVFILSGGPHSVHTEDSPSFPSGFVEWAPENGVFVLGICYGLQLLVQRLGGEVRFEKVIFYLNDRIAPPVFGWKPVQPLKVGSGSFPITIYHILLKFQ
ncbi:GMP synthase [glutamine-hydrolyzing] [Linum perenne]